MTIVLVLCGVIAFAIAAGLGGPLIALLRRLSYRQNAYEDAPKTHQVKTGTPTMGGVLFLIAPVVALALVRDAVSEALVVLFLGCAAIGFIDDFLGIRFGRNRGLTARTKFLATALVAVAFLGVLARAADGAFPHALYPFAHPPFWLWYALGVCVVLATTHAVNLTDGLDGLATGTVVSPLIVLIVIALREGLTATAGLELALLGTCVAFFLYNRHPAKLFMGDTGSLALGGMLAGGAVVTGMDLLLPLIGGVFLAETVSVIVQVVSYKTTRRRVFRMSPLHHHFELGGWPETKVTTRFWIASALLSLAGLALVTGGRS